MNAKWSLGAVSMVATFALMAGCDGEEVTATATGPVSSATSGAGGGGTGGTMGSGAAGGSGPDLSLQGQACPSAGCPAPLECVTYCGFAGCGGNGTFSSCEIPCDPGKGGTDCPAGQTCFSVADGPGDVCQPS